MNKESYVTLAGTATNMKKKKMQAFATKEEVIKVFISCLNNSWPSLLVYLLYYQFIIAECGNT